MKRIPWLVLLLAGWAVAVSEGEEPGKAEKAEIVAESVEPSGEERGYEEIPEGHRKAYFEKKPDGFLVDPQRVLSPVVRRDRAAFLEYHAGDSSIDLHLYLLCGGQRVPEAAQCEELVARFFSGDKPSAVLFYPFGEPERAVLYLSPGLKEVVPDAENKRALASSVMQAVERSEPAGQLEAFLVQMSIRLYWMERLMGKEDVAEGEAAEPASVHRKEAEEPEVGLSEKLEPWLAVAREWMLEAGVVFGVGVLLVGGLLWSRLRARRVLPDFSVEPRLGGEHGAGVGAVISFANASVPTASQRGRTG